ncbi:unnamed protein product [Zymoseptoria tritici ST99CH_1A5]|uniref:Uncharacterized protein n=1 Tax=Zymoseptoria tritici ST99CH_1A5 TaxID=1276529 RepID=A0A1Y6LSQ0_ZYMTR|nr:unnamed protein product [Zymoseptoria tritici ST99CH_1A5]
MSSPPLHTAEVAQVSNLEQTSIEKKSPKEDLSQINNSTKMALSKETLLQLPPLLRLPPELRNEIYSNVFPAPPPEISKIYPPNLYTGGYHKSSHKLFLPCASPGQPPAPPGVIQDLLLQLRLHRQQSGEAGQGPASPPSGVPGSYQEHPPRHSKTRQQFAGVPERQTCGLAQTWAETVYAGATAACASGGYGDQGLEQGGSEVLGQFRSRS